jgi:hypothetical protein
MYLSFQAFACVLEADLKHLELEGRGLDIVIASPAERHCWPVSLIRLFAAISR